MNSMELNQTTKHHLTVQSYFPKTMIKTISISSKSTGNTNTFQFTSMISDMSVTPLFINMQSYSSLYKNLILTKDKE